MSLRKYPFLADPRDVAAATFQSHNALEEAASELFEICVRRLEAIARGEAYEARGAEEEVLSFWLSLMALREAGSTRLLERALRREGERLYALLEGASLEELVGLASAMGAEVKREALEIPWAIQRGKEVRIRLEVAISAPSYLSLVAGTREERLKLVNSFLLGGWVYMDARLLRLFLKEALPRYLLRRLRELEPPEGRFIELVMKARALEAREAGVREELFPKCIVDLLAKARVSVPSDEEVFVILSFLRAIGAPSAYVEELLRETGLGAGREGVIAAALARLEVSPYSCKELKERGMCECEEDLVKEYLRALRKASR
ncbi:MAG: hypothetical protein N3F67_00670 [Acidilobaceae archaeon]|nr:hypothetical protein [Acidilobaceae archaeon]